ncbi:Imm26 family immunity protein [Emticicia sp. TH156]|uniref:Imm26 family immunity protein n=1 Tax=Emticicia sp. TH156 TaxID=2067454 RepID=UPI000C75E373|nr:Imm26 family immunity protein [Emticicia sp. TH156]PLK42138.1 hypothetical protein C0V77_22400 [Emticicia sp. TH156]
MKRQRETPGSIFSIKIDEKNYSFGRILNGGSAEFYDYKSDSEEVDINFLIEQKVIFYAIVFSHAITKGRWHIIGKTVLGDNYKNFPKYYLPDVADENYYRIMDNFGIHDSTKEACRGLELGYIWEPQSIEQRLVDYYNNEVNEEYNYFKTLHEIKD